ncbi:TrmB family transcriptional regulator [Paenibacillus yonginensis]|uniref:TrmB family transcriptional regulator n=1 Tax=Paenibacillus yonginensis TaxID=1462996 RepID=A0A1B1N5R6_9BACL|nr:TrmB family transcriptional regulator [Paenibacillus yonginensis]ANS76791.1 TrmB family transcriptional regulator [Paenibacillus yonginensis]
MIEQLRKLGLSELEAKCYLVLHQKSRCSGYEVSKHVSVSRSNVYAALRLLHEKGLCRMLEGDPVLFEAVPIKQVVKLLQSDFDRTARTLVSELEAPPSAPPFFANWKGDKLIRQTIRRLIANAEHSIWVDVWAEDLHQFETALLEAEQRKVSVHLIVMGECHTALQNITIHSIPKGATGSIRHFTLLADNQGALVGSFGADAEKSVLESNHPSIVDLLSNAYRHDVIMLRIEQDFGPELTLKYGEDYQKIKQEHPEIHHYKPSRRSLS